MRAEATLRSRGGRSVRKAYRDELRVDCLLQVRYWLIGPEKGEKVCIYHEKVLSLSFGD